MNPHSIYWSKVNYGKLLAIVGIVLNLGSSIGYCVIGDYRRSIYYLAAAILTTTVVF